MANRSMETICREMELFSNDDGLVRVPFLIKGQLVVPPDLSRAEVEAAFVGAGADSTYIKRPTAQIVREPVIDRATMRYTTAYRYYLLPPVHPLDLIETDIDKLVQGPYALRVADILAYLEALAAGLARDQAVVDRVRELCRATAAYPDIFLDGAFATFQAGLDVSAARAMIEAELSVWERPGSQFLEGWVSVPAKVIPGLVPFFARGLPGSDRLALEKPGSPCIRAMPTRQLHITAGNAPSVPIISALRLLLTKSAGVIKSPAGAILPGALFGLLAASAAPGHPLTDNLSVVYWPGGDESVENFLFMPNAFDRVIVWGAPGAVTSVQSRAAFTRTVSFNPRYGISMIGREAFDGALDEVTFQAAMDALIYNQKACNASHVQYVEGSPAQVEGYAERLREVLSRWDSLAPQCLPPATRGQLKRLKRGRYSQADWHLNSQAEEFSSGVVVVPGEFDVLDHPLCRLVVIRPVEHLEDALPYLHQGVSTAGVYPETRRGVLRDRLAARGVSNVLPLGQAERFFAGMPHDGMLVLSQLVDWKSS